MKLTLIFILFISAIVQGQISFDAKTHPMPKYKVKVFTNSGDKFKGYAISINSTKLIFAKKYYREGDLRIFAKIDTLLLDSLREINFSEKNTVAAGFGKGLKYGAIAGLVLGIVISTFDNSTWLFSDFEGDIFVAIVLGIYAAQAGGILGMLINPIVTHKKFKKNDNKIDGFSINKMKFYTYEKQVERYKDKNAK